LTQETQQPELAIEDDVPLNPGQIRKLGALRVIWTANAITNLIQQLEGGEIGADVGQSGMLL